MNKLIVALCASAFAFGSVSVMAGNDMKPLTKMETQDAKAARAAAKAKWDKMTPAEQDAARKAARAKKQMELTALDDLACNNCFDAKAAAAEAKATKSQPVPTKAERQQYGTTMDKKASSGQ